MYASLTLNYVWYTFGRCENTCCSAVMLRYVSLYVYSRQRTELLHVGTDMDSSYLDFARLSGSIRSLLGSTPQFR